MSSTRHPVPNHRFDKRSAQFSHVATPLLLYERPRSQVCTTSPFWHDASPIGPVPGGAPYLPLLYPMLWALPSRAMCPSVGPRAMCPECSLHVGYTILLLQSLLHVCMADMASAPDPWSRAMV